MADVSLRLLADASGAQGAFKDLGSAVTVAGSVLKDFAADSIKAFGEAERVQKQLHRAAGDLTEAFEAQAEALSSKLAVEDESIKRLQSLGLTYGMLPQQIGAAIEAVEDYSVVTGKDANTAMLELIRAVEKGTGSLDRGRIQFEVTGDAAKDYANAIDALGAKFAGAAADDANTLEGRTRRATMAWGEFKEAVGGLFATIESKLHVLDALTGYIQTLTAGGGVFAATMIGLGIINGGSGTASGSVPTVSGGPAAIHLDNPLAGLMGKGFAGGGAGAAGKTGGGGASAQSRAEDQFERQLSAENQYLEKKFLMERQAQADAEALAELELHQWNKNEDAKWLARRKAEEKEAEAQEKNRVKEKMMMERHEAEQQRAFQRQEEMWARAGDRMGAALVDAIGSQLLRLAQGGDVDPAEMVGDVVSVVLTIVGAAVGTYLGAPQVGGAIGGLVGGFAKTGIVAAAGRKKHDGGLIERFHGGGWPGLGSDEVPIIAQHGEHMLSRRDVASMGGPAGVESAKRGGGRGGNVYNISALDAQSFADSMGDRGGTGFYDALRIGRGALVPILGR